MIGAAGILLGFLVGAVLARTALYQNRAPCFMDWPCHPRDRDALEYRRPNAGAVAFVGRSRRLHGADACCRACDCGRCGAA